MTKPSPTSRRVLYPAGCVIVVPFPYSDRMAEKRRPALVVSAPELEEAGFIWVLMITTARRGIGATDVPLDDPGQVGLTSPCVVRPTKIACIEPSRVAKQAGLIAPATLEIVLDRVHGLVSPHPVQP